MQPVPASKRSDASRNILDFLIIIPVLAVIALAVIITLTSMAENIRFARATDQIVNLVSAARDMENRNEHFATQPGTDVLAAMAHAGVIVNTADTDIGTQVTNPWQSAVHAVISVSQDMRIETNVPPRACRRLAMFFVGQVSELGLRVMEARGGTTGAWRRFYDNGSRSLVDDPTIQAACGQDPTAALALVFRLK